MLWLDIGRMSFADSGRAAHGSAYDAMLHAVFLGFVISMIFAHAPVIVPAVLGRALPYTRWFYLPLGLLHATLLLRLVGGDALRDKASWQWGGSLNEVALLLFIALSAAAMRRTVRGSSPSPRASSSGGIAPATERRSRFAARSGAAGRSSKATSRNGGTDGIGR